MSTIKKIATVRPWATKYRPRKFSQVAGHPEAIALLTDMLETGTLPNALMLSGPSGTGKTTLALMFARYINCETLDSCGKCKSCTTTPHPDIAYSNAADTRGIDDMRAMTARASFMPRFNIRVIVLDEAHQLTPQAMESFLIPLEEPPANTMYILCTTEAYKFKPTLLGRCRQIVLDTPKPIDVARRLNSIIKAEGQTLSKESLIAIADASGCQVRDSINLLENVVALKRQNPEHDEAKAIAKAISSQPSAQSSETAKSLLLALYESDSRAAALAAFDSDDATAVINQAIWCNEYWIAQHVKSQTRLTFHSPANRDFAATVRKMATAPKLPYLLKLQAFLVDIRNTMHTTATKPHSLILAQLSTLA